MAQPIRIKDHGEQHQDSAPAVQIFSAAKSRRIQALNLMLFS